MRWAERVFGVLAGVLGLAALLVTVTQQAIIEHTGFAVLSSAGTMDDSLAIAIPTGFAALGALLVALSAVQGTRRGTGRGLWTALVVISAAMCVLGVYLLGANNVWVNIGGSLPRSVSGVRIDAATLFAPAALMGIVAAVLAVLAVVLPRRDAAALA